MMNSILHSSITRCRKLQGFAYLLTSSARSLRGGQPPSALACVSHKSNLEYFKQQGHQTRSQTSNETLSSNNKLHASLEVVNKALSRLSVSPEEATLTVKYKLPTVSSVMQNAILDPVTSVAITWDCPGDVVQDYVDVPSYRSDIIIDVPATGVPVAKEASGILEKRHRKMKRHQYLKWRKRNRFKLRIMKQKRRKKKRRLWERHLNRFRFKSLRPGEGERYLAKKQERLAIYLRYLGVQVDDVSDENVAEEVETKIKRKKRKRGGRLLPGGTGRLVPEPILPEGVQRR